jgi:hypothetical protein
VGALPVFHACPPVLISTFEQYVAMHSFEAKPAVSSRTQMVFPNFIPKSNF